MVNDDAFLTVAATPHACAISTTTVSSATSEESARMATSSIIVALALLIGFPGWLSSTAPHTPPAPPAVHTNPTPSPESLTCAANTIRESRATLW